MSEPTYAPIKALPFVIALQKFIEAAEVMERVVMIPSKLTDMAAVSSSSAADEDAVPRLLLSSARSPELSLLDWFNAVLAFREYLLHGSRLYSRGLGVIRTTPGCAGGGGEIEVGCSSCLEKGLCARTSALAAELQRLTDCAMYLTKKYQESLGELSWLCASEAAATESLTGLDDVASVTWLRCHTD